VSFVIGFLANSAEDYPDEARVPSSQKVSSCFSGVALIALQKMTWNEARDGCSYGCFNFEFFLRMPHLEVLWTNKKMTFDHCRSLASHIQRGQYRLRLFGFSVEFLYVA
jgi:hypothetical protein